MRRIIPNVDPVGNDLCLDSIAIKVPIVLIDNGLDCYWYPHPLDEAGAKQIAFALSDGCQNEVIPMSVDLILPSAHTLCSITRRFDSIRCQPLRANLETGNLDRQ